MSSIPFPNKKYNIIYADPAWSYRDKASSGKRGACFKYPTVTQDWLNELPVQEISNNDCILFIWVTHPKLNEVFDLIKNWGFEYKTCAFTWVKRNKKANNVNLRLAVMRKDKKTTSTKMFLQDKNNHQLYPKII